MTTPITSQTPELTESPSADEALRSARGVLAALIEHARAEGEQARAEVALAHLDDTWPLPAPASGDGVDARGAVLVDEAISAVVAVVHTAEEAQTRARGLRALEVITSCLDMPRDVPSGQP
ncbi:hypothetical protein [Quadrisphaera sp. INWT6]|uniref:hypothetical protein n=1 Tax=Quadrisphaera sp. INWT6 TaxID=2596917 RepID=UPI0018928848|nr:hypothetical protein [Quadrisphaera sp. INWT6]MBF5083059.1 hypothetical protein [Quadrisphaera sp. INWT6]